MTTFRTPPTPGEVARLLREVAAILEDTSTVPDALNAIRDLDIHAEEVVLYQNTLHLTMTHPKGSLKFRLPFMADEVLKRSRKVARPNTTAPAREAATALRWKPTYSRPKYSHRVRADLTQDNPENGQMYFREYFPIEEPKCG